MSIDIRDHGGPFGGVVGEDLIGKSQGIPNSTTTTMSSKYQAYSVTGAGYITSIGNCLLNAITIQLVVDGKNVFGDGGAVGASMGQGDSICGLIRFEQSFTLYAMQATSYLFVNVLLD